MLIPIGFLGAGGAPAGSYELISTTILGSDTASVTFDVTGLGSTYKHLQIRSLARDSYSATSNLPILVRFNGDSASNYSEHKLYGNGSVGSGSGANTSRIEISGAAVGNTATTGSFGASIIDILDFAATTKYKTLRALSGETKSDGAHVQLSSGNWRSTSAITSILLYPDAGPNWKTNSRFSLYGIKG